MFKKISLGILGILILGMIAIYTSCGGSKDNQEPQVTGSPSPTTVVEQKRPNDVKKPEPKKIDFIFPEKGQRPYAVMIDNQGTKPLPQGGLDKAQVIYELLAEGGITRLMPVFWSTAPKLIGPVRSSRHYFIDYAIEHDSIYVHFGWSPMARRDIAAFKVNNINGVANGGEVFWNLTKDRYNWQDSYTSMEKMKKYVKRVGYRTKADRNPVFEYNTEDVDFSGGKKANKVYVNYNSFYYSSYIYDKDTGFYKRFRKGKPHMERVSKKQLTAKNIIIQYVNNFDIAGDEKGRQQLADIGTGSGWFISRGKAVKLKWSKESRSKQTEYMAEGGTRIMLNPGQTWIQIIPSNRKIVMK